MSPQKLISDANLRFRDSFIGSMLLSLPVILFTVTVYTAPLLVDTIFVLSLVPPELIRSEITRHVVLWAMVVVTLLFIKNRTVGLLLPAIVFLAAVCGTAWVAVDVGSIWSSDIDWSFVLLFVIFDARMNVPGLLLCTIFGIWTTKSRKIPIGYCAYCEYDLRGNVSGVCPECGHRIENATKTALPKNSCLSETNMETKPASKNSDAKEGDK